MSSIKIRDYIYLNRDFHRIANPDYPFDLSSWIETNLSEKVRSRSFARIDGEYSIDRNTYLFIFDPEPEDSEYQFYYFGHETEY